MLTLIQLKSKLKQDLTIINKEIEKNLTTTQDTTLKTIYQHILNSQGKQVRSMLMVLIATAKQPSLPTNLHTIAAAIELIHLASLVHDDIIDAAETRRNQASVNAKFGQNNAIISGVHIYASAYQYIAKVNNTDVLMSITNAVSDLCEGESQQVNQRHHFNMTEQEYWHIVYLKTSALFRAACESAGYLCTMSTKEIELWQQFGCLLGDIFQLSDDYLDIFDTNNALNKKIDQDFITGDITLPMILAAKICSSNDPEIIKNTLNNQKQTIGETIKRYILERESNAKEVLEILKTTYDSNTQNIEGLLRLITDRIE